MRMIPRFCLLLGLVAGAVALGCQAVVPASPRAVVRDGTLVLAAAPALAVVLTRDCPDDYALAQAAGGLDARIARIVVKIEGPSLIDPLRFEVTRAAFGGRCSLTTDAHDLPPGDYVVTFNALDAGGDVVATATGRQVVTAGRTATLTLECDFDTGAIVIDCCDPPPGPVTTPTPRSSFPPLAGEFERIHGLHADDQGNVYLFGLRPRSWPDAYSIGRIAKITPDGTTSVLPGFTNYPFYEGHMSIGPVGSASLLTSAGVPRERPNAPIRANETLVKLGALGQGWQGVHYIRDIPGDFLRPWGASAGNFAVSAGNPDPARAAAYVIGLSSSARLFVDRSALVGDRKAATERPLSMIMDVKKRLPIWSCKQGILTCTPNRPTDPPRVLVARSAYALTNVDQVSNKVLFTTYEHDVTQVFFADLDAGTAPTVAYTFAKGSPHRIERGADGAIYVLLAEPPLPFDAASGDPYQYEFPGKREVRVVQLRFDAATKRLTAPRMVFDSFKDPAPSWVP